MHSKKKNSKSFFSVYQLSKPNWKTSITNNNKNVYINLM